jgi:hypothetical protein
VHRSRLRGPRVQVIDTYARAGKVAAHSPVQEGLDACPVVPGSSRSRAQLAANPHDDVAGERSALCDLRLAVMAARGSAVTHVSAIMRVLKDDLIGIFAGCLSPAAGRGNTGPLALPLTVGLRWYGRAGGTLEDGDVGQQPAHHAMWIREKPDGPHLRPPVQRGPTTRPPHAIHGRCLPACRSPCATAGRRYGCARTHPPGAIPRVACKRMPAVSPESTGPAFYGG